MNSSAPNELFRQLTTILDNFNPVDWDDIVSLLNQIKNKKKVRLSVHGEDPLQLFAQGAAFVTFSYGVDGVSVESSKYAHSLNELLSEAGQPAIHLISGNFKPQASSILSPEWHRFQIDGIDGWNKWEGGKWFNALFRREIKAHSDESELLTKEIYTQAVSIAKRLGKYLIANQISLIISVNVASNPGNIALTLGLVLVTEILGIYVLNSNHDFYWEAGKPLSERAPGEKPGVRDHFFRNIRNRTFFSLFKLLYPWNGSRWLQLNINARQSRKLKKRFGFPEHKIFEISTCVAESFFEAYSNEDVIDSRVKMGYILSNGEAIMRPVPIDKHLAGVDRWMKDQQPIILGARSGLSVDPRSDHLIIMLQPTRVVRRKRIARNLDLISALFRKTALREEFENNPNRQLILHITGPTPREHQADLEKVLFSYQKIIRALPEMLAERVFLAFSTGRDRHASFTKHRFEALSMENIYRIADAIVFPSQTEGRGLPIIEASATGIPIICSHYHPREVFRDVIGEGLPEEMQIQYTLFPEGRFSRTFLSDVSDLLIHPDSSRIINRQNREAVRMRYSPGALKSKFERLLSQLERCG